MNRPRKNQTSTLNFVSYAIASAMSLSLVACAGGNGPSAKNGVNNPTGALEKASAGLKIEKINGINVITKASIESYLYDLKNNAESQAAKSFETIKESNAVDFAKQSWSDATNEPLDVMGYRFENLADWGAALEEQIGLGMGDFSTMSDYLKSGGVESANDIVLESINDSLLAAEEFFAQDPVTWLQANNHEPNSLALQSEQDKSLVGCPSDIGPTKLPPHLPPSQAPFFPPRGPWLETGPGPAATPQTKPLFPEQHGPRHPIPDLAGPGPACGILALSSR